MRPTILIGNDQPAEPLGISLAHFEVLDYPQRNSFGAWTRPVCNIRQGKSFFERIDQNPNLVLIEAVVTQKHARLHGCIPVSGASASKLRLQLQHPSVPATRLGKPFGRLSNMVGDDVSDKNGNDEGGRTRRQESRTLPKNLIFQDE